MTQVQKKRRPARKTRRKGKSSWLAVVATLLAVGLGAAAALWIFGLPPQAELYLSLRRWTQEWRAGDATALEEGMYFAVPDEERAQEAEEGEGFRTAEEMQALLTEQYAALLDPEELAAAQAEAAETDLFSVLMPYTQVSFSLPARVEAGECVTFTISGPDMAQILPDLPDGAAQAELLQALEARLAAGGYAERTVTAEVPIEALEEGYRVQNAFALIDGLYGGLPGIVQASLPAVQ